MCTDEQRGLRTKFCSTLGGKNKGIDDICGSEYGQTEYDLGDIKIPHIKLVKITIMKMMIIVIKTNDYVNYDKDKQKIEISYRIRSLNMSSVMLNKLCLIKHQGYNKVIVDQQLVCFFDQTRHIILT